MSSTIALFSCLLMIAAVDSSSLSSVIGGNCPPFSCPDGCSDGVELTFSNGCFQCTCIVEGCENCDPSTQICKTYSYPCIQQWTLSECSKELCFTTSFNIPGLQKGGSGNGGVKNYPAAASGVANNAPAVVPTVGDDINAPAAVPTVGDDINAPAAVPTVGDDINAPAAVPTAGEDINAPAVVPTAGGAADLVPAIPTGGDVNAPGTEAAPI